MQRRHVIYSAASLVLWMLGVTTGERLPYVYTADSVMLRSALFAVLTVTLLYFGYVYKGRNGLTGWQSTIRQSKGRERIKMTVGAVLGLFFICGFVAWTSTAFPAWGAQLFASTPYVRVFKIRDIQSRGGPGWSARFDVIAIAKDSSETLTLRLPRTVYDSVRPLTTGADLCVHGRSSMFGTAIDSVSKDTAACNNTGF